MNLGSLLRGILHEVFMLVFLALFASTVDEPLNTQEKIKTDPNMQTEQYQTDVTLDTNGSYLVKEKINVQFTSPQHGIYRTIPVRGIQRYKDKENKEHEFLYNAKIKLKDVNTYRMGWFQNGNYVLKMGDWEEEVNYGNYQFSYRLTPYHAEKDYHNIYYNVLPGQWRNPLPKGSSFTIRFPKKVELSELKFYSGEQGQTFDARKVADIKIDSTGHKVTGTLTRDLPIGWGITCFGDLGKGYFTSTAKPEMGKNTMTAAGICLGILTILYLKFGRDDKIIPSVQFQPPNLDSAAVDCIVSGGGTIHGVISLLLYWADRGYVFLKEEENAIIVYKLKNLPSDVPEYQTYFFDNLFTEEEPLFSTNDVSDRVKEIVEETAEKISEFYENQIYTKESEIARTGSFFLILVPLGLFMLWSAQYGILSKSEQYEQIFMIAAIYHGALMINIAVDIWYSFSRKFRKRTAVAGGLLCGGGLISFIIFYIIKVAECKLFNFTGLMFLVCGVTLAGTLLNAFMKKRTKQCVEWMGYLVGYRDFIETAEMDRMKVLGKQYPNLFYHILPYAYVFDLSEIYAKKLEALNVEMPVWFDSYDSHLIFQYECFNKFSTQMSETMASYNSSSSSSGSYSGGSSGGGFGGGGGGSW